VVDHQLPPRGVVAVLEEAVEHVHVLVGATIGCHSRAVLARIQPLSAALGKISPALLGIISPVWWQSLAHDLEPRSLDWRIE
jgi:hypothetical protein